MSIPRSRWSIVAAFSLVGAATQMVWLTFAGVTTVSAERYDVSVATIGWLANVFVLCFVLLAIPAGLLLDRHLRPTLLLGAVLTAVGACVRLVDGSFGWLLVGGFIAALGQPIILTGIAGLTHNYLAPADRAKGIAIATASTWAGFIGAFALSAVFAEADQMDTLVRVHAAYAVLAAAVFAVALRGPVPFQDTELAPGVAASLAAVRSAWRDPLIRLLCLFGFVMFGTFMALTTWTEALLEPAGVSVEMAGIVLIAAVVAGVVGTATLPVWAARRRREVTLGIVAVAVTAAVCAMLALTPSSATALIGLGLAGLLLLPMLAIALEMVERHSGDTEGVASGLVWTMGNLGGLIVTGIIGLTVEPSPALSFVLLGAVTLLALPVLFRLRAPVAALPTIHGLDDGAPRPRP